MNWVRKQSPEFDAKWSFLYRLTEEEFAKWLLAVGSYARLIRSAISAAEIEHAVSTGRPETLYLDMVPAENALRERAAKQLAEAIKAAGTHEVSELRISMTFQIDNPFVNTWINNHTAELVAQVTDETRRAIRSVITEAFQNGDPPRKAAMRIRSMIGLTDRDAKAVMRRWKELSADSSITEARVAKMTDEYAQSLLRRRALNIARTETVTAANRGVQIAWQEAQRQGSLLPGVHQEWIAAVDSPRTCAVCLELDSQQVPVGQPFYSPSLGRFLLSPPAHPSCRCAVGLVRVE